MFCRHRQWKAVRIRRNAFASGLVLSGPPRALAPTTHHPKQAVGRGPVPRRDSAGVSGGRKRPALRQMMADCGFAEVRQSIKNDPRGPLRVISASTQKKAGPCSGPPVQGFGIGSTPWDKDMSRALRIRGPIG